jgi:hypothetical protein
MSDAKRFTEDTGKFGGGTGRSGIQGEHGNVQKEGGGGDTGRFGMGDAERFKGDTGRSDGDTVRFR